MHQRPSGFEIAPCPRPGVTFLDLASNSPCRPARRPGPPPRTAARPRPAREPGDRSTRRRRGCAWTPRGSGAGPARHPRPRATPGRCRRAGASVRGAASTPSPRDRRTAARHKGGRRSPLRRCSFGWKRLSGRRAAGPPWRQNHWMVIVWCGSGVRGEWHI